MKKNLILATIFFTIFLDFFNLGLIYPIFTSLVFEGNGDLISLSSSDFYKNAIFGVLISAFPLGQFIGAPIIGQLSDQYGRRILLILSLIGTVATLLLCALGVFYANLTVLIVGRFIGGLMSGNMTLAYASLADFSSQEEKVKNFALIPLATGLGFASGPYLAGMLANPDFHSLAGPTLPFLLATLLAIVNLLMILWKFPETIQPQKNKIPLKAYSKSVLNLWKAIQLELLRPYLAILFLMISANFVFVQFIGPFAIDRFQISVTEVGYLYANIGIAVALGHLFLTRGLANYLTPEKALMWSLLALAICLLGLFLTNGLISLHLITFLIMLACAIAYTNSMTIVSNQATQEQQGEIMGIAVSIQSCSEFLPAILLGLVASISQAIPITAAAIFALCSYLILAKTKKRFLEVS
ncbi:MAG: MFS transporter [Parachlamydiaceae bacterium]|nr:MFS transporter [Parachlamydiaceae bacterium]